MTTAATTQPTPSVASAAFRALAAWLVIYAVIGQLLVIPKWRSSPLTEQVEDKDMLAANDTDQEQRIQLIQRLMDDAKEIESRHQKVVDSTIEQLERMRRKVMKPLSKGEEPKQVSLTSPDLTFFQELMGLPTLSNVDETRLLEFSKQIQSEVDAIFRTNATISWSQVNSIVTARYERQGATRECPSPRATIDPSLARESHLYQKFQQTERLLRRRAESMPPLLHQDRVVEALHEQARKTPPPSKTTETANDDRMCISQHDVTAMMDEGINALMRRHLDVRQVLTRFVLANYEDILEKDFILDASLDPPLQPILRARDSINLRQVVDTPLLKEVAQWVDAALDRVGGHVDSLDQLVDSLAADDTSVGKTLIAKLQSLAGKVELPNIWAKVPTRAGILRPGK